MKSHARPRFGTHAPSRASQGAALAMLLCGATPRRFAELSVDGLKRMFPQMATEKIEQMLADEIGRRAGCERGE